MPKYPYTSGQAALAATMIQLRKGAPAKVDAQYLQRFELASSNESYVISILRFLGLVAEDGTRIEANTGFLYGDDDAFRAGMDAAMRAAYAELFTDMGDEAVSVGRERLIPWFRATDKTSTLVGGRQASTFMTIAAMAGHGEVPTVRGSGSAAKGSTAKAAGKKAAPAKASSAPAKASSASAGEASGSQAAGAPAASTAVGEQVKERDGGVGLTVRIEVNLPAGGDSETYDAIFASIRKHLMS